VTRGLTSKRFYPPKPKVVVEKGRDAVTARLARNVDNLAALLVAGALAAAVAGCGANQPTASASAPSSSSSSAAASLATPGGSSIVASPAPSLTQDQIRAAASKAYVAAAQKANKDGNALAKKYPSFKTLAVARAYYKAAAAQTATFLKSIRKIIWPADTAADGHSLIAKSSAVQALELAASHATSWARLDEVSGDLRAAYRQATAAANLIRGDLGLKPVG
jgi:hypothetical protein